jgi:site-specific DNA-cytosine methylase
VVCAPHDGFGIRSSTGLSGELDGRRLKACGNAVNVSVTSALAHEIRRYITCK